MGGEGIQVLDLGFKSQCQELQNRTIAHESGFGTDTLGFTILGFRVWGIYKNRFPVHGPDCYTFFIKLPIEDANPTVNLQP